MLASYLDALPPCTESLHPPPPDIFSIVSHTMTANYTQLPAELRYAVVDLLEHHDAQHLAYTSRDSYALCIPALFKVCILVEPATLHI